LLLSQHPSNHQSAPTAVKGSCKLARESAFSNCHPQWRCACPALTALSSSVPMPAQLCQSVIRSPLVPEPFCGHPLLTFGHWAAPMQGLRVNIGAAWVGGIEEHGIALARLVPGGSMQGGADASCLHASRKGSSSVPPVLGECLLFHASSSSLWHRGRCLWLSLHCQAS